jgi:hypothetical protein
MELDNKSFETGYKQYLENNRLFEAQLTLEFEALFDKCKKRFDNYFLKTESLLSQLKDQGYSQYYEIINLAFFQPYSYLIKSLDIRSEIEFGGFFYSYTNLNNRGYKIYAHSILKEIYIRELTNQNKLDLQQLFNDFEDFIYYRSIYDKTYMNVSLLLSHITIKCEFDNILMETGLMILEDLSSHTILTAEKETHYEALFNSIISKVEEGFEPFENFPVAINELYSALYTLQTIEISRERFIAQIIENATSDKSGSIKKIDIKLKKRRITRKAIGLLFFLIRTKHSSNYEKVVFKKWLQKNFRIFKMNAELLDLENDRVAADLISQYPLLNDQKPMYKSIRKLVS